KPSLTLRAPRRVAVSGGLIRRLLREIREDALDFRGLLRVVLPNGVENRAGLFDLPGAPETGAGAQTAADGEFGSARARVILGEDHFEVGGGQEVAPGTAPVACHFREQGPLHFPRLDRRRHIADT